MKKGLVLKAFLLFALIVSIMSVTGQSYVTEERSFRTRLDSSQQRSECSLELGEDNWRSKWCGSLDDDQSLSFDECYRQCLITESRNKYCANSEALDATVNVSEDISTHCASICFDSLQ